MFVDLEYLDEATKVTMTFGRMNPVSVGHEKLVDKVRAVAKTKGSEPRIYLSHTQNSKKDPLSYIQKIKYAKGAFGNIVKTSTDRNIVQLLQSLQKEGVKEVTMVVGSDRVSNFRTFLKKYNGKDFTFDKITVVSAGQRDPDDAGVAGMSGTKLRGLAAKGDEKSFSSGLASGLSATQKSKMFKDVRDGMNISEQEEKKNGKGDDLKNEPFLKISDDELEKMIDDEDDDELEPDEWDVEVAKYIFPDDEEELENGDEEEEDDDDDDEEIKEIYNSIFENEIDERVLNFQQRQKIAMRMRRLAPKMARLRKIRAKRMATPAKLVYRARKAAMVLLRKRAAGKRGENYKSLSRGEKMSIDRTLQNRYKPDVLKKMIAGFSRRLLPMIRKKETLRLRRVRSKGSDKKPILKKFIAPVGGSAGQTGTGESVDMQFDNFMINEEFETFTEFTEARGRKSAVSDQGDAGDDNIIYQMRKVIVLRGQFVTKFQDGSKLNVSVPDARKVLSMYGKVRLPKEKQAMVLRMMKNKQNFEAELAGKPNIKLTRKQQLNRLAKEEVEIDEKVGDAWKIGDKFVINADDNSSKKLTVDKIAGNKLVGSDGKKYSKYGVTKFSESFELFLEWPHGVSTGHPVAAPTSHIAPVSSALVGNDEDPSDKDSKDSKDSKAKVDTLLRLGLVPRKDLVKYRRALKGGESALKHPELRSKIGDLLQRLLKITTSDKSIYAKLRLKASEKEKVDKQVKEDIERRADFKMVKAKLPDGRVVMKKSRPEIKIGDVGEKMQPVGVQRINPTRSLAPPPSVKPTAAPRVTRSIKPIKSLRPGTSIRAQKEDHVDEAESPLDRRHEREKDRMVIRQARQKAAFTVRTVRKKAMESLEKKSDKSGIPVEVLEKVFDREDTYEKGFNRVNSFIAFGEARKLDRDLYISEDHGAGEEGTDELSNTYKRYTPGQSEGHSLAFDYVMKPRIAPTAKEIAMHESQPNKFTSETVLIFRTNKVGEVKEMRIGKNKVYEYLSRGWQRKSQ